MKVIDLVSSAVYPGLERKPGGPDNWVERAGGLPKYIERIAKHLHYERGYSISRAIAVAVNTVKRWAAGGFVTEHGTTKRVTPKTQALAAAALASWEAKRKAGSVNLSDVEEFILSMTEVSDEFAWELYEEIGAEGDTGADPRIHAILSSMDVNTLAQRANQIEDPEAKAVVRQRILDLAVPRSELTAEKRRQRAKSGAAMPDGSFPIFDRTSLKSAIRLARTPAQRHHCIRRARSLGLSSMIPDKWTADLTDLISGVIDLASTIPPRNARGRAKDGRRSYRDQGQWKHGYIPVNRAAKESKAKGSPIAIRRLQRIYGKSKDAPPDRVEAAKGRAGQRSAGNRKSNPKRVKIDEKSRPGSESAADVGFLRHSAVDAATNRAAKGARGGTRQKEASKETRIPERARQNWDEIPESLKTVRNGKRYVVAEFGDKQYVTEWVGGVREAEVTPLAKRKVMRTLSSADAADMSQADLRALVNNPRTPASVKRTAQKALKKLAKEVEK